VSDAIQQYIKSQTGTDKLFPQFNIIHFFSKDKNLELLKQLGLENSQLNTEVIASNPKRMQNVLNYWAFDKFVSGRDISTDRLLHTHKLRSDDFGSAAT